MSLARQPRREVLPAFFVEDGAMSEHDSVVALSVEIPVDITLVLSVERHFPKRGCHRRAQQEQAAAQPGNPNESYEREFQEFISLSDL